MTSRTGDEMHASLEKLGLLPRAKIVVETVDRETVRAIVRAERELVAQAARMGMDIDEVHLGYSPYIAKILDELSDEDKAKFERLLVEETLNYDELDEARVKVAVAEQRYVEALQQPKSPSTARIFLAGVNVTILIGLALFWALK
jgi:hypothetical protein